MTVTRYYFSTVAAPAVTPAFSTDWDVTTAAQRLSLATAPSGGSTQQSFGGTGVANQNRLWRQFISSQLSASVLYSFAKGQSYNLETNATDDYCSQLVIRGFSGDGLTERGVLLAANNSALSNELAVGLLTNTKYPRGWSGQGTSLNAVRLSAGDVLVVEMGFRTFSASVASCRFGVGANAAFTGDLPEDETTTTANLRTWIDLDDYSTNPTPVGHPAGAGVGLSISKRWTARRRTWTPRV